jgi:hypothetical protein
MDNDSNLIEDRQPSHDNLENLTRDEKKEFFKRRLRENMGDTVTSLAELGRNVLEWGKEYAMFTGKWIAAPYIIPTLVRLGEEDDGLLTFNCDHVGAMMLGSMTGMIGIVGEIALGFYLIAGDAVEQAGPVHWGYLLAIPIANAIDGFVFEPLYKTFKETKENFRER